ncbi:nucleotidyltransferase domain-containing protein [Nocardioides sp. NPDC047086]|uniref:nucleotidyltransferase family protein n=1 Tax=Nocardioides sp. NPDC047086 TaxID=3154810 RepID=UPI0033C5268C
MDLNDPFGGVIPGARGAVLAALLRTGQELTGRQVHGVVGTYSLGSVQDALKAWERLGILESRTVGRAYVYRVEESHVAVEPLRALLDPIAALTGIVSRVIGNSVESVIVFGSVARGEANADSDIDLAVIASEPWDGRADLREAIRVGTGNECDILVFTSASFSEALDRGEPVVLDVVKDGVALIGHKPRHRRKKPS